MISPQRQSSVDSDGKDTTCDIVTVGKWLKAERENRKESLDNVSAVTRIGKIYLEAIEEGDYARLPGQAYLRGFVRLYATHLGLSAEEALRVLDQRTPSQTIPVENPQTPPTTASIVMPANRSRVVSMAVVLVILSTAIYAGFYFTTSNKAPQVKIPEAALNPPATGQPQVTPTYNNPTEPSTQPVDRPAAEQQGDSALNKGLVLRLKAIRDGRMHITIDSAISQEYELVAGDVVEWKADKSFQIDLDDASTVEAELDGKQLTSFGNPGKSAHLVITRNGLQQN